MLSFENMRKTSAINFLAIENTSIEYTLTHRPRVTRRLHLELDQTGKLVVVAPQHWSRAHVQKTLAGNLARVQRFVDRASKKLLSPLKYVHGEPHLYLGEHYPLEIHVSPGKKVRVQLVEDNIQLQLPRAIPGNVEAALYDFYRRQAGNIFRQRLQVIARKAFWANGRTIELKVRRMKRTWGNCSVDGVIKLNTHLVKAPMSIVDAVIAHEICHLAEMNHSPAFYRLLEGLNPGWQEHRTVLRSMSHIYLL